MADEETLAVYNEQADAYCERFSSRNPEPSLSRFKKLLPEGGAVLDLGCGPGNYSANLQAAGFRVSAVDASDAMVKLAIKNFGIDARRATFDDLDAVDAFDGVWANFSLLHAEREEFPRHLARIAVALRKDGVLHLGMKTGSGERRDRLGRYYTYYSVEELRAALQTAGFDVISEHSGEGAGLAGDVAPWTLFLARLKDPSVGV